MPSWILHHIYVFNLREGYFGDLEEEFGHFTDTQTSGRAIAWIWCQAIRSLPVFISMYLRWSMAMLKNAFKSTWRNIGRQIGYSIITVLGLAIGMTVFLLITLFMRNERSWDDCHQNAKRIFRIVSGNPADKTSYAGTPAPLGPLMKKDFPEVEDFVRLERWGGMLRYEDRLFEERRLFVADNSIFRVFTFPLLKGNPETALTDLNSIVITESMAEKYFEDEDPLGRVMHWNDTHDLIVTGVVEDVPLNAHFHFDFLVPFEHVGNLESWGMWNYNTYLLLHKPDDPGNVKQKFDAWAREQGMEDADLFAEALYYQPIKEIHFQYNRSNLEPAFNGKYLKVLLAIAVVVLTLACINFINLSTARSSRRSLEVGIRKVVGSGRNRLIWQFIGESVLLALISLCIALVSLQLAIPWFNHFSGRTLSIPYEDAGFYLLLFGIILFSGFFSGVYPAFVLSSFQPVRVLKGETSNKKGILFRNILVVFQFSISILLMVCALLIYNQMRFIQRTDIGINPDQVINVRINRNVRERTEVLKNGFLRLSGITHASAHSYTPTDMNWHQSVYWQGQTDDQRTSMWIMAVDKDFFGTMQIPLIEGQQGVRNFRVREGFYDYVLNRAALDEIGWETAAGKAFSFSRSFVMGRVLGVTENFNFRSLHHAIAPCVMVIRERGSTISLRVQSGRLSETLSGLKKVWDSIVPEFPFEYEFLDEQFGKLYASESKLSELILIFTGLSFFIGCLGLFSLASFSAAQKTKEIGIRKVMGASVSRITLMLSREYTKWVLIANVFAWPVGYFVMRAWLQNFEYRISIGITVFLISGLAALSISLITVSSQSIRAAMADPVRSLRYE